MQQLTQAMFVTFCITLGAAGCGDSTDPTAPADTGTDTGGTDSGTDTGRSDSNVDAPTDALLDSGSNTCLSAGGRCIALTATSSCGAGSRPSADPAIHCEGVGSICCLGEATDAGPDIAPSDPEAKCLASGGTIGKQLCCSGTASFPNTCGVGACSCAPSSSTEIKTCTCPARTCFDGTACVKAPA